VTEGENVGECVTLSDIKKELQTVTLQLANIMGLLERIIFYLEKSQNAVPK
jgi:hypothetical protein